MCQSPDTTTLRKWEEKELASAKMILSVCFCFCFLDVQTVSRCSVKHCRDQEHELIRKTLPIYPWYIVQETDPCKRGSTLSEWLHPAKLSTWMA